MSRIPLIDQLIEDNVARYGGRFLVKVKNEIEDRRGSTELGTKTIHALSQPMSLKERQRMGAGDMIKEWRFFSMTGENKVKEGDIIIDNNKSFEVKSIQDWGTSMKSLVVRVD
jgi:hypothetical protein